jgi:hypothetical protein
MNDGGGGYNLITYQRSAGSFTSADLTGTWNIHMLTSGDSPQWLGWVHGVESTDSSGKATWSSITRSDGNSTLPGTYTLSISSSGIVSIVGYTSFHGVMSQDKSTIIATMNDGGGGYNLITYQRSTGSFTSADLVGTWNFHLLTTGDSPQWLGWAYGVSSIDGSGNITMSSITRSDGNSTLPAGGTLSISSGGIVSVTGVPSPVFDGFMSQDKNTIIVTTNDGGGGYNLIFFTRQSESSSVKSDFNADGKPDLIWQNTTTGQVYYWLMDGLALSSSGYLYNGNPVGLQWQIAGVGDMNSDGKPDLIWRNTSTGTIYYWLMNGLNISTSGYLYDGNSVGLEWQVAGVGDMNADGKPDLIWRNISTGTIYYWLMDGLNLSSSGYLYGGNPVGLEWQVAGIADMNSDGKPDLIWRNISTGTLYYWLMDGLTLSSSGYMYDGNPVGLEWDLRLK